jgi:hypothetical protein
MAGLLDTARPLDRYRSLLAPAPSRQYTMEAPYTLGRPGPPWQQSMILPSKFRDVVTQRDPIYGAPQAHQKQTDWGIPAMASEMAGSLLTTLEAPYTGVMPSPADLLNVTPMTSAPGLLFRAPAGALASGLTRRAIGDNQGPPLGPKPAELSPLGFYSPTEQAVLNLKQTTLTPDQARASLANLGAKKEEMQWMGMDDFLAGRPSVTQDELLDFVRQNRVNVEQVNYGGPDPEALIREADELLAHGQGLQEQGYLGGAQEAFYRHDELMRQARELEASPQGLLAPKFSEYTLPGGENYREVVLTMPTSKYFNVRRYEELRQKDVSGKLNDPKEVQEFKALMDSSSFGRFQGSHFPEDNTLAHVRMNDRIDADGKKVLFIEEIQSDWHQMGRRRGYKQPPPPITPDIQLKLDRYNELEGIGNRLASSTPKELTAEWQVLKQDLQPWLDTQVRRVPDAPFKKTWSDLAMKRVMQMAADEGYDRVAWTTGRMQADRYDLSKQISEVHYSGTNLKAYDHNGATVINQTGIKESDLPDLIGKEAADKLLAQKADGTLRSLVGQDLQVGGEWAVKFYDEMLPKKAQKIARRLDKDAKVGRTTLEKIEPYNVTDPRVPYPIKKFKNQDVWSIDITPAMRKRVQAGGQPLFANPAAAAAPGLLSTQQPAPPPSLIMDSRERVPRSLLDAAA